jgi:hypothetical protein
MRHPLSDSRLGTYTKVELGAIRKLNKLVVFVQGEHRNEALGICGRADAV